MFLALKYKYILGTETFFKKSVARPSGLAQLTNTQWLNVYTELTWDFCVCIIKTVLKNQANFCVKGPKIVVGLIE